VDELTRFPPALQLLGLGVLAAYVAVSILARWRYPWLWSHDDASSRGHLLNYTVVPALVFVAAVAAVWSSWSPGAPLDGGWSTTDLVLGPAALLCALALVMAAGIVARVEKRTSGVVTTFRPLLLMVGGLLSLGAGVFLLLTALERVRA